jgi:hypothetical protein
MPVSDTPSMATTHLEAEVRAIVRVLRSYGALPRPTLKDLVGAQHWRCGDLSDALQAAIAQRRIRHLGAGFYEARTPTAPTDGPLRTSD